MSFINFNISIPNELKLRLDIHLEFDQNTDF